MVDVSELVERLNAPVMNEALMQRWDTWRAYIKKGGGSWPRDAFESIIDGIDEERAEAATALATLSARVAELERELARALDDLDDAKHAPWPKWANNIRQCLEGYGVDPGDEWDLPEQFEDWLRGVVESETARAEAAESRASALEAEVEREKAGNPLGYIQSGAEAAARFGFDRGRLQAAWRALERTDKTELPYAIIDALSMGGWEVYPGDGVGCVARIVEAQMDRAEAAERERDALAEAIGKDRTRLIVERVAAEARVAELERERDEAVTRGWRAAIDCVCYTAANSYGPRAHNEATEAARNALVGELLAASPDDYIRTAWKTAQDAVAAEARATALEAEVERMRVALNSIKDRVISDRYPNWYSTSDITSNRMWIAIICDVAARAALAKEGE